MNAVEQGPAWLALAALLAGTWPCGCVIGRAIWRRATDQKLGAQGEEGAVSWRLALGVGFLALGTVRLLSGSGLLR